MAVLRIDCGGDGGGGLSVGRLATGRIAVDP